MFQDFHRRTVPETSAPRLAALREAMRATDIAAFLVPRSDAHQGENVAPRDERLAWLTSFTGSAGSAVVTGDRAAIFVDGRYRLQVRNEVDQGQWTLLDHPEDTPSDWLRDALSGGGRVGYDPWLHTAGEIEKLREALEPHQFSLLPVDNLIDAVWTEQPPPPAKPIVPHPDALAGRSSADKRGEIARGLMEDNLDAAVLTLPDSIAWLLNVRGADVPRTPVPRAFAVLHRTGRVTLFAEPAQVGETLRAHLGEDVRVAAPDAFGTELDQLVGRIAVDRSSAPLWVSKRLSAGDAEVVWRRDPCILPKARKTEAEIAGAHSAHLRDGAAMVEFLAWLDSVATEGNLTEIDVARRLEAFRSATGELRDIAFETICGSGPHGAVVHYRVSEASNRAIEPGEILLIDSGAQYADGTTDVTRTLAIGHPPDEVARPFTLVLKGLIAMSRLRWPQGLSGREIDAVARTGLWAAGFDYDHGTGHGVGAYLGVHEGPQALSRRSTEPLLPGMILSIEPGYYRENAFGIRLENLAVIRPAEIPEGGDREMLVFETLTLVPIDRRMIDIALLDDGERAWLNAYHAHVEQVLAERVSPDARPWLGNACRPI